jgi:hypothetical protein
MSKLHSRSEWVRISSPNLPRYLVPHDIDFRRKARFVAGGHTTDTPHTMNYAIVVSRESVIIALTLDDFNDLDVKMADIENAYLTAPITEKVWSAWSRTWR